MNVNEKARKLAMEASEHVGGILNLEEFDQVEGYMEPRIAEALREAREDGARQAINRCRYLAVQAAADDRLLMQFDTMDVDSVLDQEADTDA